MIRVESVTPGIWNVIQYASLGNIERERELGQVIRTHEKSFVAATTTPEVIACTPSLPAAIQALLDLHKMTDYQYAPWPTMAEEEEEG